MAGMILFVGSAQMAPLMQRTIDYEPINVQDFESTSLDSSDILRDEIIIMFFSFTSVTNGIFFSVGDEH